MYASFFVVVMLLVSGMGATSAEAAKRQSEYSSSGDWWAAGIQASADTSRPARASRSRGRSEDRSESRSERRSSRSEASGVGARPGAWCGWYMRTRHGGGPEYNLAWNWSRYGSSGSPQVGAIVVWPHHVGEITGRASNGQWIVLSGNDGGRVRERARSISGAVIRV
jgi:hypothetical protein